MWLDKKEYGRLSKVRLKDPSPLIHASDHTAHPTQLIRDLHNASQGGEDDQSQRGTQLLEIYALEIQMYNETRKFKKLKVVSLASYTTPY